MSNLRRRVDRLMQDARRISWKPHLLLLTGQENEYKLEVHEWNGVPGSARDGSHIKTYTFPDKAATKAFVGEMEEYWRKKYSLVSSDLLLLDLTIPAERKSNRKEFYHEH